MSDGTSSGLTGAIPPGWYPDPAGGDGKRWWDGIQWTIHTQEPPEEPPLPSFGNYVPADLRPVTPLPVADAGTAYSRAGWWIAFSPIWIIIPQVIVVESITSLSSTTPLTSFYPGLSLLNLLLWAIVVALGFADRTKLMSAGNDSSPAPWWILLTPLVYLILRARHVQLYATGAWALVVWWCIATIVTPGLAILAIFAAYGIFAT